MAMTIASAISIRLVAALRVDRTSRSSLSASLLNSRIAGGCAGRAGRSFLSMRACCVPLVRARAGP